MTDEVINQMNITNASCVIHFNFPGSKTQCGRRLTTLAGTFTSSEVPTGNLDYYLTIILDYELKIYIIWKSRVNK